MTKERMPTTLPSPADRAEFRFVAVDAAGRSWRWIDEALVWVRVDDRTDAELAAKAEADVVH